MEDIAAFAPRTAPARTAQKAASGIFLALLAAGACALAVPADANATTVAGHVTDHLTGEALGGVRISIWYQLTPFATYEVGAPVTASDGSYTWVGACGGGALHVCHVSIDDARYVYADTPFPGDTANVTADIALVEPATISGDIRVNGAIADGPLELAIMRADGGQWAFVRAPSRSNPAATTPSGAFLPARTIACAQAVSPPAPSNSASITTTALRW